MYFILNLGTLFLIILGHLIAIFVVGILFCVRISGYLKKLRDKLASLLFWNGIIRLLIEAYFDVVLALGVTYLVITDQDQGNLIRSSWGTLPGVMISQCFALFFAILCIIMPFAMACFYWKNSDKWDEKKWR